MNGVTSRHILGFAAAGALAFALSGCDSIRAAAGLSKQAPDEFAITTKAPLVIPPDYNLRPPKPGAAPTNQSSPSDAAQGALFEADPNAAAANLPSSYSDGEKALLASAGAAGADDSIRRQIAADDAQAQDSDESFTDQVLFGSDQSSAGTPVNADAEAQRIQAARAAGENPATAQAPQQQQPDQDQDTSKQDSGSWLDDIFNW